LKWTSALRSSGGGPKSRTRRNPPCLAALPVRSRAVGTGVGEGVGSGVGSGVGAGVGATVRMMATTVVGEGLGVWEGPPQAAAARARQAAMRIMRTHPCYRFAVRRPTVRGCATMAGKKGAQRWGH